MKRKFVKIQSDTKFGIRIDWVFRCIDIQLKNQYLFILINVIDSPFSFDWTTINELK